MKEWLGLGYTTIANSGGMPWSEMMLHLWRDGSEKVNAYSSWKVSGDGL